MNQAIRNTWIAVVLLFVLCLGSLSYVQFFAASDLNNNALNKRQLFREFDLPRGAILVDGKPIAESKPSEGQFKYQRTYTDPELYAFLTGFYSLTNSSTQLESVMNDELTGQSQDQFFDRMINLFSGRANEGASVELTIDGKLQKFVYDLIPDGTRGTIIVSEPKTGNILAMASKPSYDTNLLAVQSSKEAAANMKKLLKVPGLSPYVNPALGNLTAPGSTFKVLDLVAAIESGKYNADTVMKNPAKVTLPGTTTPLGNFFGGNCAAKTEAPLSFIVAQSCNTPFVEISEKLGAEPFEKVTKNFGFGQQLNIPLRVVPSVFPPNLDPAALGQSVIGQRDVKATAMQMNMVAMGIANGGKIMQPNLIKRVIAPDLKVLSETKPKEFATATSKDVADQVTDLMRGPVKSGTAVRAQVPGLDIAAKTGTSQIGGSTLVNSWITGFAPANDPQVAVTIVFEKIDFKTGSSLTSPNLKKILEAVFNQ
ncbi:penicillin-binding transpeptidase domain-containing protein [Paeniglutamicibacter kerguelensis]|uniref:Peptidoglycan glycosyltransferase n=1 Tax=Paeniglutamicibacter kerguelensis TaxID=254788 RepID=A0ABS4XIJ5_9MICC|nr:penicillin-binding transpeptidase domain-containing protein [Paeniglutamicibacter kerguelensis]MBP2388280.1 peptidoglycan glycosyltransferase [Paeniglutamicibacter kerguelensis]